MAGVRIAAIVRGLLVSMWFGFTPKIPSDAALRLMRFARGVVLRDDWERALDPKVVKEAAELIVNS